MRAIATVAATCNSCGSSEAHEVGRTRDYEFNTCSNEFVYVRCDRCQLVYLRNRPHLDELRTIYPPEYYDYHAFLGPFITWVRSQVQRGRIRPIARHAPSDALVVDVGCGNGELLRLLKAFGPPGWALMGVDFSPEACALVEQHGIAARCGLFESLDWYDRPADLIIMNQVIEHVADPRATVRKARDILKPGGVLFIETPSMTSWDGSLFRPTHWGGWHCPRHWNLYDPATLRRLVESEGLEVVEISCLLSPYFWCHSLQNFVAERLRAPRAAALFSERMLPTLVLVSLIDVLQLAVTGRTSNMRVVGRRPSTPAGRP